MKLLHIADLHIGKRVNGFSMIEDQKYILNQIIRIADEEKPDAMLIAGDVYDRSIPSEEAVDLFDDFLVHLSGRGINVYIISGNHDSAERVAFGGRLMEASGIHFAPVYHGDILPLELNDAFGTVKFWMIPFLRPIQVRRYHPEIEIETYTDAMQTVIDDLQLDRSERNVAVAHQFITGASIGGSEESSVGGLDQISGEVFDAFDYVALGHLHGPQKVGREVVRYSGSPLKYSFSEWNQEKGVTVIELGKKGEVEIREVPLEPYRDLVRIRGEFEEVMQMGLSKEDYYEVTLTDEEDVPNAVRRLQVPYPNLMVLKYDNTRTRNETVIVADEEVESKSTITIFDEFYEQQNGQPMSAEQRNFVQELIEEIWGGDAE